MESADREKQVERKGQLDSVQGVHFEEPSGSAIEPQSVGEVVPKEQTNFPAGAIEQPADEQQKGSERMEMNTCEPKRATLPLQIRPLAAWTSDLARPSSLSNPLILIIPSSTTTVLAATPIGVLGKAEAVNEKGVVKTKF
ncbi:hypothetical protein BLNAU_1197 [Blattamonas nauphoetae]|uniref:Uncharacterized protein n=1 Tax=Blattamonas nauphoetae TaxID=2049346 RepID=A0ABQ9YIP0_9EUKA|nr:hypothetical protein BLNAU_1197 [Blattamonas nauphoetae]